MQALPEFVNGSINLSWTGVDQPDGGGLLNSGIAGYDLQYRGQGGDWADWALGLTTPSLRIDQPVFGARNEFRVRGVDRAGNAEAYGGPMAVTTYDPAPPVIWFSATSGIDQPTFPVRWNALDPGGSGVVSLDLQFRVDGGPWQDWLIRTTDRNKDFAGEMGHVYQFRARGRDVAGNVGAYPATPQLTVLVVPSASLVYHIHLSGLFTGPGNPPR
jgi:hypothetical protein